MYYRLRQTDFNGDNTVSEIIMVLPESITQNPEITALYSANGQLNVELFIPRDQTIDLQIYDLRG